MKKWMLAWAGASVLGIANGAAREALYADAVGEDAAGVISTGTLLALLGGYVSLLERRWPLGSRREALSVGAAWAAMTVAFEFGFGRWVAGDSWADLLGAYDVRAGKVWGVVPAAMVVAPEIARRLDTRNREGASEWAASITARPRPAASAYPPDSQR